MDLPSNATRAKPTLDPSPFRSPGNGALTGSWITNRTNFVRFALRASRATFLSLASEPFLPRLFSPNVMDPHRVKTAAQYSESHFLRFSSVTTSSAVFERKASSRGSPAVAKSFPGAAKTSTFVGARSPGATNRRPSSEQSPTHNPSSTGQRCRASLVQPPLGVSRPLAFSPRMTTKGSSPEAIVSVLRFLRFSARKGARSCSRLREVWLG